MRKDTYHKKVKEIIQKAKGVPTNALLNAKGLVSIARKPGIVKRANKDVKILKTARAYDNAPNRNNDGSISDAGMARSLANDVRDRRKR